MNIINVPKHGSEIGIKCTVPDEDFLVVTTDGWRICEISGHSQTATADGIQQLATELLRIGFEQGRAHVRAALGL